MNILLMTSGRLSPTETRSHIHFTVFLEEVVDRLRVDFSYTPKFLSDHVRAECLIQEAIAHYDNDPNFPGEDDQDAGKFSNLLTLSFDDARGFRGAVHRHSEEQHLFLGKDAASPGLLPGNIPAGLFRITLSVHAVLTETCDYRLSLSAEKS